MASKDKTTTGCVRLISTDPTENPKLKAKALSNGKESLFLEYYLGAVKRYNEDTDTFVYEKRRAKETLNLYLWQSPRNPIERQENKETLQLAKQIRFEKQQELLENKEGYRLKRDRNVNFLDFLTTYESKYTKEDIRSISLAVKRFKRFLAETPEYEVFSNNLKPEQIDKDMILTFTEFLQSICKGEGARTSFKRFKKIMKYATEHGVLKKNPCEGVSIKNDDKILRKEVLSMEEVRRLLAVTEGINPEVRKAFQFCLYHGLRYGDVRGLTFENIDYGNRIITFEQNKTKGRSSNSWVTHNLSDVDLELLGRPTGNQTKQSHVFNLPTNEGCNKALKAWMKLAGIDKKITWHCARHSFGTNLACNNVHGIVISSLMGHSNMAQTEKYLRVADAQKMSALSGLQNTEPPQK